MLFVTKKLEKNFSFGRKMERIENARVLTDTTDTTDTTKVQSIIVEADYHI